MIVAQLHDTALLTAGLLESKQDLIRRNYDLLNRIAGGDSGQSETAMKAAKKPTKKTAKTEDSAADSEKE